MVVRSDRIEGLINVGWCAQARIAQVSNALKAAKLPFGAKSADPQELETYEFKNNPKDYNVYWDVRKGLIPIVGAARETGTFRHQCACPRSRRW